MTRPRHAQSVLVTLAGCVAACAVACDEATDAPVSSDSINAGPGTAVGGYSPAIRGVEIQTRFKTAADGIAAYLALNGDLPGSLADLTEAGFAEERMLRDPWDRPLMYETTESGYRVWTAGPDGESGTEDDIDIEG